MPDNSARIAEIEAILAVGVSSVAQDGGSTSFDLARLRKELRDLRATDNTERSRRPVASTIRLTGL